MKNWKFLTKKNDKLTCAFLASILCLLILGMSKKSHAIKLWISNVIIVLLGKKTASKQWVSRERNVFVLGFIL